MLKHLPILFAAALALALNACGQTTTPLAPTGAAPPAASCPDSAAGVETLTNESHGYCAAIPIGYNVLYPNPAEIIVQRGSQLDPAPDQARLYIQVGDARGRTAADVADQVTAGLGSPFPIERADLTLGGEPAVSLNHVPGQDLTRQIVAVHGGQVYRLTFAPLDAGPADTRQQLETLYEVVVRSFRFVGSPE